MSHGDRGEFFLDQFDSRERFAASDDSATEIIVGVFKISSGRSTMTWSESVDQAICFGWIDGITRRIVEEGYDVRFTPRKENSIWSRANMHKVSNLIADGLMPPAGLESFSKLKENRSNVYWNENEPILLSFEFEGLFKSNEKAWEFFTT